MKRMHVVAGIMAAFVVSAAASALAITFTPINVPGAILTEASGINNRGQVVGDFLGGAGGVGAHAFLKDGATITTFDVPGADLQGTVASGINSAGQIVGYYYLVTFTDGVNTVIGPHGFVKDGATFTTFDVPGGDGITIAYGINDAGQVVGWFETPEQADGFNHGFVKDGGTFTRIDVPGATDTYASGINNAGQIVGTFVDATGQHGFLKDGSTFTTIDVPGAISTWAKGINNTGQIVGVYDNATGEHGFLKDGATLTTVDVGALQTDARGINDLGQIVGFYRDLDVCCLPHGFVTPALRDMTPPVITLSVRPSVLWPPNHKLVEVTVNVTATDDSDPNPRVELLSITSNEPSNAAGDGNTDADIVVQNGRILLRAERSGLNTDRVYTITYRAIDAAGNSATASVTVTVPH